MSRVFLSINCCFIQIVYLLFIQIGPNITRKTVFELLHHQQLSELVKVSINSFRGTPVVKLSFLCPCKLHKGLSICLLGEEIGDIRWLLGKKVVDNQIFVGRLLKHICSRGLEDIFFPYGKLTCCKVKQGIRLAFGFVEFENRRDAEDAICLENGREIMGTRIVMEWSRGHKDKNSIRGYDQYYYCAHDWNCYDRGGRGDRYSRRRSYSWSPP